MYFHKIWKTLKTEVKLIVNCLRALAITFLSHKGQNSVRRKSLKVRMYTIYTFFIV